MLFIDDTSTNPYKNLAAEEYLLKNFDESVFRLWRNENAIIVGRYQNTIAEIDIDYITKNKIKVVRRITGGGAVFHDLGNLNFTFIEKKIDGEDAAAMFKRFTFPIIEALNSLEIKAYLDGRNDLLINDKKFSGNAICIEKNRILQHGTLLFSSSMTNLSNALRTRPEKFQDKAIKSNRSRVTNIASWLKNPMQISQFKDYIAKFICDKYPEITPYHYSKNDLSAIESLCDNKYATDKWNFGQSPKYSFQKVKKLSGGIVEIYFSVNKGIIKELKIYGDYFFTKPTEDFIKLIIGTKEAPIETMHNKDAINERIKGADISGYFNNISKEEIIDMLF